MRVTGSGSKLNTSFREVTVNMIKNVTSFYFSYLLMLNWQNDIYYCKYW